MNPLIIIQLVQGAALTAETIARIITLIREAQGAGANISIVNDRSVDAADESLSLIEQYRKQHPE